MVGAVGVAVSHEHTADEAVMIVGCADHSGLARPSVDRTSIIIAADAPGNGVATGCLRKPRRPVLIAGRSPLKMAVFQVFPDRGAVGNVFAISATFVSILLDVVDLDPVDTNRPVRRSSRCANNGPKGTKAIR